MHFPVPEECNETRGVVGVTLEEQGDAENKEGMIALQVPRSQRAHDGYPVYFGTKGSILSVQPAPEQCNFEVSSNSGEPNSTCWIFDLFRYQRQVLFVHPPLNNAIVISLPALGSQRAHVGYSVHVGTKRHILFAHPPLSNAIMISLLILGAKVHMLERQ